MTKMQQDAQSRLPKVFCEGEQLENVFDFVYLGSGIQADGDEEVDPDRRMAIAKSSFFDLGNVWKASDVGTGLKLRFYAAGIISILTYGAETWLLTDRLISRLRNWNARCLSRITGRSVREEHVDPTFDLIPRLLSIKTAEVAGPCSQGRGRALRQEHLMRSGGSAWGRVQARHCVGGSSRAHIRGGAPGSGEGQGPLARNHLLGSPWWSRHTSQGEVKQDPLRCLYGGKCPMIRSRTPRLHTNRILF